MDISKNAKDSQKLQREIEALTLVSATTTHIPPDEIIIADQDSPLELTQPVEVVPSMQHMPSMQQMPSRPDTGIYHPPRAHLPEPFFDMSSFSSPSSKSYTLKRPRKSITDDGMVQLTDYIYECIEALKNHTQTLFAGLEQHIDMRFERLEQRLWTIENQSSIMHAAPIIPRPFHHK